MADNDLHEWRLVGTTLTAASTDRILPVINSHFYFVLNESGSGEVSIPLDSAAAGVVTEGMLAVLYYRGAIRASFLIENIRKVPASSQEEAGQVLSISGRGGMTLLDRAIVWSDGTTATTRTFTNTKAGVMIALIVEAQARGGLTTLTYDFDATNDSDAVAWTDSDDYKLTVGTTLLDVLRGFAETGIEFEMNYSGTGFVLSAYKNGIGTDKSSTVFFRIGTNCQEIDIDQRGNDIKNALLVTHETGSITVSDSTSITANGRREELLDARYAQSTSAATTYGAAILATVKDTRIGRTIKVYDGIPPYAFLNYILGDEVTLDVDGTLTSDRILGIQCDFADGEYSNVVIELNELMLNQNLKMKQDLDRLLIDWQTAHDAGLLEVSYWKWIGYEGISAAPRINCVAQIGNEIYGLFPDSYPSYTLRSYNIKTGVWKTLYANIVYLASSMVAVGTDLYFGSSLITFAKYETLTGTLTSVANIFRMVDDITTGGITAMAVSGTDIYIGGSFETCNDLVHSTSLSPDNIILYDSLTGLFSYTSEVGFGESPTAMIFSNGSLYSSGTYGGQLQVMDGGDWVDCGVVAGIVCLAEYGTSLLVGGTMADGIFIWDGATLEIFGDGTTGDVSSIVVYLTDVYVSGAFTDLGNYIAKYSGGSWWQLGTGLNGGATTLLMDNTSVIAFGSFTTAGDKGAPYAAKYFSVFEDLLNDLGAAESAFNMGAAIHNATASAITDGDEIPFWEDVTNALRKITWANILTTVRTWLLSGSSDTQVLFNDAGSVRGEDELTYDLLNRVLEVGGTNWYTGATRANSIHTVSETGGAATQVILGHSYQDGTGNFTGVPIIGADRAGGSKATPTAVLDDMGLVRIVGGGYDGVGLSGTRAQMVLRSAGNWAAGDHPTSIEFWTTPVGSITRALSLTVKSTGNLNIPTGKTYDINDVPHTHAYGDIGGAGVVGQVAEFVTNTKTLQAAKLIAPAVNILTITNAAASTLALSIAAAKQLTLATITTLTTVTNVYLLGDSITGGSAGGKYQTHLDTHLGANFLTLNKGNGGETSTQIAARVYTDVINKGDAGYVVIIAGTVNPTVPATVEADLQAMYTACHNAGIKVIAGTVPPRGSSIVEIKAINTWISTVAVNVDYIIDIWTVLNDPGNDGFILAAYDSGDLIHPNAAGCEAMADAIYTGVTWEMQKSLQVTAPSAVNQSLLTTAIPTFAAAHIPYIYPTADSVTALQIRQADGATVVWNVDTTNKRIGLGSVAPTAKFHIVGTENAIQLRVLANATQTAAIQTWENSSGTVRGAFVGNGAAKDSITDVTGFLSNTTSTADAVFVYGNNYTFNIQPATQTAATSYVALNLTAQTVANAFTYQTNTNLRAFQLVALHNGSVKLTGTLYGGYFDVKNIAAGGVSTIVCNYALIRSTGAGTIDNARGFEVANPLVTAGAITNVYGLYINTISTGATLNYSIYTNAAASGVRFGSKVQIIGSADAIQSRILANATQTANVWTLETSAAAIVNSMSLTAGAVFNEQGTDVIDFRVESDTKTNMLFLDSSANAIGINQATPTAYLHLGIGSTAAGTSPLKFTQDATSLLTAVEAGAMEYYKNALWFTNLAVRRTVVQGQSVKLTDQTIANSTTETEIFSQAHGANYLQVGKLEDIFIQGIISSLNTGLPAANALTVRIKYAGATIGTFTILKSATANRNYEIHVRVTCRAIGAGTTTMQAHANCDVEGAATDPVFNGTSTALDSTTAQATTITVQWDAASASNTTTVQQAYALSIDNNA